ncbi:MAG: bacteriocin fulvocin C-related protein [Flavobacteriaceae bacterium]|nr:bacteriocin fulvocin C-related protein [Flavobacteriaceae bacterium]
MKNYLVLFCLGFLLVSCNNEGLDIEEQIVDMSKIEAMKSMDEASQKAAFNILNSNEKHKFRIMIMDRFIENNELNDIQIELINELKSNFTSEVYSNKDIKEYFKNIYAIHWIGQAEKHFSQLEILNIALASFKSDVISDGAYNRINECICHAGSIVGCKKKTVAHIGSDGAWVEIQSSGECSDQYACNQPQDDEGNYEQMGCGFAWLWSCDGNCD